MSYRVEIDEIGTIDMSKEESNAFGTLLVTKSTDSGSAQKAAETLGGIAYAESLSVLPDTAMVMVYEKPEITNAVEKIRAEYTVKALIARVISAATQDVRQGKIYEYNVKAESTKTDETVKPVGSWLKAIAK